MTDDRCEAIVSLDWSSYSCTKRGTQERLGHRVCGIHARQYDKWVRTARSAHGGDMVEVGHRWQSGMNASGRFNNDLRYRAANDDKQIHLTPEYVLVPVRESFGGWIELDPCTIPDNPTRARRFYTLVDDGLSLPWVDRTFVNPPYGKVREPWVERCIVEATRGYRIVLLMPAATDTRIFQQAAHSADSVVFVKGRLKFGARRPNGRQRASSHQSALFLWNTPVEPFTRLGITWITEHYRRQGWSDD